MAAANVGIFFGTSTGTTEEIAEQIKAGLVTGDTINVEGPFDVDDLEGTVKATFEKYDCLIVGTPTWNTGTYFVLVSCVVYFPPFVVVLFYLYPSFWCMFCVRPCILGAETERSGTGWDEIYYTDMETGLQLDGKHVAVFGCGDQISYSENYADATGELHDVFGKLCGATMGYGYTDSKDGTYEHDASKALCLPDAPTKFCGLLCDGVNQEELTAGRVQQWCQQLTTEGFFSSSFQGDDASAVSVAEDIASAAPVAEKEEEEEELVFQMIDENSDILDESIKNISTASNTNNNSNDNNNNDNNGFQPYYNENTQTTMYVSADGRSCYYVTADPTTKTTSVSP